jgi:hypothetical protein
MTRDRSQAEAVAQTALRREVAARLATAEAQGDLGRYRRIRDMQRRLQAGLGEDDPEEWYTAKIKEMLDHFAADLAWCPAPDSEEVRILKEAEAWLRARGLRVPSPGEIESWVRESGDAPITLETSKAWLDERGYC